MRLIKKHLDDCHDDPLDRGSYGGLAISCGQVDQLELEVCGHEGEEVGVRGEDGVVKGCIICLLGNLRNRLIQQGFQENTHCVDGVLILEYQLGTLIDAVLVRVSVVEADQVPVEFCFQLF